MAEKNVQSLQDAEVIYGALRRERVWQIAFMGMTLAAVVSVGAAAFVVAGVRPPAPVIVPFDPATGMAVPNAAVGAISLDERPAVVQALVYQYVLDRETYNQVDNDVRINRALDRSTGAARSGLVRLWDSGSPDFLPSQFGDKTIVNTIVTSINIIDEGRVQVRMRKQLISPDGETVGNFTANVAYNFDPGEQRTLEAVWQNPLAFEVTEYSIFAARGT